MVTVTVNDGFSIHQVSFVDGIPFNLFELGDVGTYTRYPGLRMSDSKHRTSDWTPTVLDVLAEDWTVYPNWIVETQTVQGQFKTKKKGLVFTPAPFLLTLSLWFRHSLRFWFRFRFHFMYINSTLLCKVWLI